MLLQISCFYQSPQEVNLLSFTPHLLFSSVMSQQHLTQWPSSSVKRPLPVASAASHGPDYSPGFLTSPMSAPPPPDPRALADSPSKRQCGPRLQPQTSLLHLVTARSTAPITHMLKASKSLFLVLTSSLISISNYPLST